MRFSPALALATLLIVPVASVPQESIEQLKANLDLPFDALGDDDEEEEAPDLVSFYGMIVEADAFIYILCGRSSLWNNGEFEVARREVQRNIRAFAPETEFAIVYYTFNVLDPFPPSHHTIKADAPGKQAGEVFLAGLANPADGGYGWMEDAFKEAFQIAAKSAVKRKRVIYLSDGLDFLPLPSPNDIGMSPAFARSVAEKLTNMNTERIPVDCVDVRRDGHPGTCGAIFLRDLAARNGGQYKPVYTRG